MKYRTTNELHHFLFAEAHIAEARTTPDSFSMILDNVTILPENSKNRDIRQMRANQLHFTICDASICSFVEEGYRIYDANGNLKEQIADRALLPEEYGAALAALSDCTLYSIERRKGRYEISIDGEDHTFLLAVSGNGDVQEWERFLSLDGEF